MSLRTFSVKQPPCRLTGILLRPKKHRTRKDKAFYEKQFPTALRWSKIK